MNTRSLIVAISLLALLHFAVPARAATFSSTWNSTSGNWNDSSKWNTASFPNNSGSTYDATINGGTVTLNQNITIQKHNLNGGILTSTNAFRLTLKEPFTWTAGANVNGNITIQADAGMNVSGVGDKSLGNASSGAVTLILNGVSTLGDSLYVPGGSPGTVITNNSTFNFTGAFGLFGAISGGAQGTFNNLGTINKSGAFTVSVIAVKFNTSGPINVNSGTLSISGTGSDSSSYNVASAGTLLLAGRTLGSSSNVTGAGDVTFNAGTTTLNGANYNITGNTSVTGTATFNGGGSTRLLTITSGGGVRNGPGGLSVSGLFTWGAGTLGGTGSTVANAGINFSGGSIKNLGDGAATALANNGTSTLSSSGLRIHNGGATFLNNTSGIINITTNANIDRGTTGGGAAGRIINLGIVNRSTSSGTSTIGVPFDNGAIAGDGVVNVSVGRLNFDNGGTDLNGRYVVNGSADLEFGGGTHTMDNNTTINASSTSSEVLFTGGITTINPPRYTVSGTTTVSGGTVNFQTGTSGNATTRLLTISSGVRAGNGTLTASGLFTWTGGTLDGTGTTTANGGINLALAGVKTLTGGAKLTNNGTANMSGGDLRLNLTSSQLTNQGTFNVTDDANITSSVTAGFEGKFVNSGAGVLAKSGPGTTTNIDVVFTNAGFVDVTEGVLAFTSSFTQTAGMLALNGGNVTTVNPLDIQGGSVIGIGTITGDVSNQGTLSPGF